MNFLCQLFRGNDQLRFPLRDPAEGKYFEHGLIPDEHRALTELLLQLLRQYYQTFVASNSGIQALIAERAADIPRYPARISVEYMLFAWSAMQVCFRSYRIPRGVQQMVFSALQEGTESLLGRDLDELPYPDFERLAAARRAQLTAVLNQRSHVSDGIRTYAAFIFTSPLTEPPTDLEPPARGLNRRQLDRARGTDVLMGTLEHLPKDLYEALARTSDDFVPPEPTFNRTFGN